MTVSELSNGITPTRLPVWLRSLVWPKRHPKQALKQLSNQAGKQSSNHAIKQSSSQAIKQSSNQAIRQSSSQAINRASQQAIKHAVNQASTQSISGGGNDRNTFGEAGYFGGRRAFIRSASSSRLGRRSMGPGHHSAAGRWDRGINKKISPPTWFWGNLPPGL